MNKSNHLLELEEVMAYLDGELSTDRAVSVVSHLERCSECQEFAAYLKSMSQQLSTWQVGSPSERIDMRIASALNERGRQPKTWLVVNRRRWQGAAWAVAGAVAGVVLALLLISTGTLNFSQNKTVAVSQKKGTPLPNLPRYNVEFESRSRALIGSGDLERTMDANSVSEAHQNLPEEGAQNADTIPEQGPMIIRTAKLALTTKDFDQARPALDGIVAREHGYIADLNLNTPGGAGRTLTATLRVPFNRIDAVMVELRKLGRVESESQNGVDATSQYVDLAARLSNAKNTEQRLTDVLRQRTGKLADVLAVETEISRVRGDIESMEAQRKNLANMVSFANINTTITEDYQAQLQVLPLSTSTRFRNAAVLGYKTMADGVVDTILFLISYLPSALLCAAILFFPIRSLWRKLRPNPVQ